MSVQVYQVWRVDCDCGSTIDYGEDASTVPECGEECGGPIGDTHDD